VYSFCPMWNSR